MAYFDPAQHPTANIPERPDRHRTVHQHRALKATLKAFGCEVIDVPGLPDHPNCVFTRDVALCTPEGHLKLRMGLPARRGEEEWMSRALASAGEPCLGEISAPGTVEGGDVILAGSVAFVGISGRTNRDGARELATILKRLGYEVRVAPVAGYLHIGGAMSVIGPRRVLCCRGAFPEGFFDGFETVEVTSTGPGTGNVICLDEKELIANAAENSDVVRTLERYDIRVHALDLSEFRKGAAGPTCLILPVERR
jgi:dimethylargininase